MLMWIWNIIRVVGKADDLLYKVTAFVLRIDLISVTFLPRGIGPDVFDQTSFCCTVELRLYNFYLFELNVNQWLITKLLLTKSIHLNLYYMNETT